MSKRSGPLAPGVAFITGGARGLGNAVAVSFAKEGARGVVLVDIQDDETFAQGKKSVEAYGTEVLPLPPSHPNPTPNPHKCLTIHADVTKEEDVERAVKVAVQHFTRIDYGANFAGISGPLEPISDMSLSDWQKTQAVNSTGIFLATKHLLRQMLTQSPIEGTEKGRQPQRGAIVNCASVNSLQTMPTTAAYTASKHACAGLTKTAALEGRAHGVRVNSVSPGFLNTGLVAPIADSEVWRACERRQGRRAELEEVGDAVVVLCSTRMSLVNGVNLFADGGFVVNEGVE